jgi:inner membrane organizing system protein 1
MSTEAKMSVRSEDQLGTKWDHCLSDTSIKIASGLGIGIIFSVLFAKRRPWPLVFGIGMGLGMGYANCQYDFNHPEFLHGKLKKIESSGAAETK